MRLGEPIAVTTAVMTASNVAETEADWSSGATYAAAVVVKREKNGVNRRWISAQASNSNHDPATDDGTWWIDDGATNRWNLADGSRGSQTTNADAIVFRVQISGKVDTFAFQNVDAESIRIVATDALDGVVHDQTWSMVSDSGIDNVFDFFNEQIRRIADLTVVLPLSLYADLIIDIEIVDPGETVAIGEFVPAISTEVGGTRWSPSVGIQDFSEKAPDGYGAYDPVERGYANLGSFQVLVASGFVDSLIDLLSSYRARPMLFIGDEDYASTVIYGYYEGFDVIIAYPTHSLMNLKVQGLA